MRRPNPSWETDYQCGRRKHRHRCCECNRIIQPGERVVMAWKTRGTVAAHAEHARRDVMKQWGLAGLKAHGWHVPELDTHYA